MKKCLLYKDSILQKHMGSAPIEGYISLFYDVSHFIYVKFLFCLPPCFVIDTYFYYWFLYIYFKNFIFWGNWTSAFSNSGTELFPSFFIRLMLRKTASGLIFKRASWEHFISGNLLKNVVVGESMHIRNEDFFYVMCNWHLPHHSAGRNRLISCILICFPVCLLCRMK